MVVDKIINNNIVTSHDQKDREIIIMGKGLGFGRKSGDEIPNDKIEKVFLIRDRMHINQFAVLLENIPIEHVRTSSAIIEYAKEQIGKELSENVYIALTDHINFAIERYNKNIPIQNALLWEIKKFYNKEYQIGKEAVRIVKEQLGIQLSEDEAGFIALHIVNAEMDTSMNQSMTVMKVIQDILSIIKYFYQIEINVETLDYERFITHLKFFIQRIYSEHCYEKDNPEFCKIIAAQFPKAFECSGKIKEYIKQKMNYDLGEEEIVYLTVHIQRVTR